MAPGTATTDSPYSSSGSQTIVQKNMDDDMPDDSRTSITGDNIQSTKNVFEPIRGGGQGAGNASERAISSRPLSLHSSRSYGGGDGYGCMNDDEQVASQDDERPHDTEKEFEVRWDGEDDPMNPRSMSKLRKWLIVMIVSWSSLCVYVSYSEGVDKADTGQNLHILSVHLHIWTNHQGISLLSDRRHAGSIAVCYGSGYWPYASRSIIRGRDLFRVAHVSC